jgi:hypothetical protein
MANLSREQAIKLIKEPANRKELSRAIAKRQRHNVHAEAEDVSGDYQSFSEGHLSFLRWVDQLLQDDENFKRFKSLYRQPVPSNELVESIFDQFVKIFNASDAFQKVEFDDPDLEGDFNEYRKKIGDLSFWETQGFESFKTSIDNVLVVDLPRLELLLNGEFNQESEHPEPYYFMLDIDQVIDMDNKKVRAVDSLSGKPFYYFKCEYLIFHESADLVCVFDDTLYRVFKHTSGEEPVEISSVPHNLGYCPARSFWTTPLSRKAKIQKSSPITKSLSELDWFLFFNIAAKYLKLYAPFPIYAIYKSSCNYKDTARNLQCSNGYLASPEHAKNGAHSGETCPRCKNKFKPGPGKIAEVKPPQDGDQPDLMANPLKVIPAETESLAAVDRELSQLKQSIFENCVGKGSDITSKEAINEDQVKAGFEKERTVLFGVKKNFELAQSFVVDTLARLRYGERYKGVTISYGTEFFTPDEEEEISGYKTAKETGLPEYDLDQRREKIAVARYHNDPDKLERLRILKALDPFPDKNLEEALKAKAYADELDLIIKANFVRYIDRFERENLSLLSFGRAASFDKKIAQVYEVLRSYATELQKTLKPEPPPVPPGPPAPPGPPKPGDQPPGPPKQDEPPV